MGRNASISKGTVLVTGARGTVGNYVVGLCEAAGYRVVATDLTAAGVRTPLHGEVKAGDLRDPDVVRRLVGGCSHVIHTAAQMDAGADATELAGANTDAVVRLYEAAEDAGVRRFVHMSTAMLYGRRQRGPLDEHAEVAPRGPHGLSKHGAEAFLRGRKAGPLSWTILRAAPLYGRRGRHFAASLLSIGPLFRLSAPWVPTWSGGPRANFVHAEDVARALIYVLDRGEARHEIYNVADDDPLPLGERLDETFRAYGLRTFKLGRVRAPILSLIASGLQRPAVHDAAELSALAAWKLVVLRHGLKPALRPRLDREGLTLFDDDLVLDTTKLRALGWTPRYPRFAEGWREVLRWYQAERWVPRYG